MYLNPFQSLGFSILCALRLKKKHSRHACYHSYFQYHRRTEPLISALWRDLYKTFPSINIIGAGKLSRHPVLWPQACTPDQHLIKRTQVCLTSNLEKISQDRKTLWTRSRSTHTYAHLVWITGMLHRSISSKYPSGETSPLWVLGWLLSFIWTGYKKIPLLCYTCDGECAANWLWGWSHQRHNDRFKCNALPSNVYFSFPGTRIFQCIQILYKIIKIKSSLDQVARTPHYWFYISQYRQRWKWRKLGLIFCQAAYS